MDAPAGAERRLVELRARPDGPQAELQAAAQRKVSASARE
jgi:hypothetical protein